MSDRRKRTAGVVRTKQENPPLGIVQSPVRCPEGVSADALLIATWRADQFGKPVKRHLARARKLIARLAPSAKRTEIGLSDHDRETFERLGCGNDIEACMVAAWLAVGVEETVPRASTKSSWDHKLIERRMSETTPA